MANRRFALINKDIIASAVPWGAITGTLTAQTDLQAALDLKATTTSLNISNWDTAYGWGNHASAGYAASSHTHSYLPLSGGALTGAVTMVASGSASYQARSTAASAFIELHGPTAAYIDFSLDGTGATDYGARIRYYNDYLSVEGADFRIEQDLIHATTYLDVKANSAGAHGIRLQNSAGSTMGYVYSNGTDTVGLLSNTGVYFIRSVPSTANAVLPGDVSISGDLTGTSTKVAQSFGSYRTTAANGAGIGFWNGVPSTYGIYMSSAADATYGGRVTGETTSDYNIYFEMNSGTNRGFVFETDGTKLFSINPNGLWSSVAATVPSLDISAADTTIMRKAAGVAGVENHSILTHAGTGYVSASVTFSTSAASGGTSGDIWFKYT